MATSIDPPASRPGTAPRRQRDRLLIPDVLRGVALLAMVIAHIDPFVREPLAGWAFLSAQINDLASPLFALVMGMSAQIMLRASGGTTRAVWVVITQNAVRGTVLIALGLWLETWGTWIAIVLAFLGVLLIVGTPLVVLGTRALLVVTALVWLVSGAVVAWANASLGTSALPPVLDRLVEWTLLGRSYRLANLLPFFLLGALLLRHGFQRDRLLLGMAMLAPIAYLARPIAERVLGTEQFSGSYLDTLHDVGLVFTAYVVVVWAATVPSGSAQRALGWVFTPLRAIGSVALSLYVLHTALVRWGMQHAAQDPTTLNHMLPWTLVLVVTLAVGVLWWRFVGRGPIEWLTGVISGRYRLTARRKRVVT
ncbi:DUF418 domain-containing protein [Serinibacter salmoneus]|uniref:Putative membrane protein YeiB n=1 Tax=Serinibacter salmoneus TaxID=556530 RepID=A0A2A9CYX8_9MICO|nr:DUF418 domain-containing protein [Serinibacter salmoneus]PFG18882.1 putative membrane protein YeiB [Serinibacter salmoneus]